MIFLKHFRHYYIKYGWAFLLGMALLIAIDYFQLEIPRTFNTIITGIESGDINNVNQMTNLILYLLGIVMFMTVGRYLWRVLLFGNGRKIETDIRLHMFSHATTLSQNFYSNQKIGGLMSYFINDLNAIRELFGFGLLMLIDGLFLGTMVLIRMFDLNWLMTVYAAIPILLMGVLVFFLNKKMQQKFKLRQESFEHMSDFTQESFTGIQVIKAYVKEAKEALTFDQKSRKLYDTSMAHVKYSIIVNIIIDVMITLVILSVIVYGSILISQGNLNAGDLSEYITYFFTLLWPVFALSWFMMINGQAQASAKRIYDFLETKADVVDHKNVLTDVKLDGAIHAKNLTFKYPDGDAPVLKNMNFEIKAGEMVGILGKTGSGKSTLVELLLHVYQPDPGMIFYSGHDMTDVSIKTLRDAIGYVPQDNFLYSDTIRNNIGFSFKDQIEESWLHEVSMLSDIYDNVMSFKEQYDTILGERGTTVSGGQKQRISIARALAKDPAILILDDSVSAVDTKTEEAIISNLRKIRKGRTTLMIAHRISTVKKLDKIILIDNGEIIGVGSHKELMKSNQTYQDMVKLQALEALVEEGEQHA